LVAILPDLLPPVRHSPKCNRRELGAFSWASGQVSVQIFAGSTRRERFQTIALRRIFDPSPTAQTSGHHGDLTHALENAFAKLKAYIRKLAARTIEALEAAAAEALQTFKPAECENFFAHAGYGFD
jgi:ribosome-associated translation inhibitor RaiA